MLPRIPVILSLSRYDFAEQFLTKHRAKFPPGDIYDIGAGDGRMRSVVEGIGLTWRGFDRVPAAPDVEKWDLNEARRPTGNSAAMILMLDVLEHLANPALGIEHVAQAMAPGGYLLLTMPNPRWSRSRIYALINGYPACFTQADLDGNGHVFTPWPHIVEKLLHDAGFEVLEYATLDGRTAWPCGPITIRYPLRVLHAMANKFIEQIDPTACGMSYAFVAQLRR